MANQATQQIGIGILYDNIRKILARVTRIEEETGENTEAIDKLRDQAESVEQDITTLKGMADTQDVETADHARQLAELTARMSQVEGQLAAKERALGEMTRKMRGEQVRRGREAARADRAEKLAEAQRNKKRR